MNHEDIYDGLEKVYRTFKKNLSLLADFEKGAENRAELRKELNEHGYTTSLLEDEFYDF